MMGPLNRERSLFLLGCFILAFYSNSVETNVHTGHGNRIKRFLFNKVEEPNTNYSSVTLCCTCNDFNKTNTCNEKCKNRGGSDMCFGKLCSTTATLLNGRFYLVSGCASEETCRQERAIYEKRPGCDTLDKGVVRNGTKCGYCCQSRDVITHGTEAARECRYNLDRMIDHVYTQNPSITSVTAQKTVTPSGCQGNACSVSTSHIDIRDCKSALLSKHSWVDYIQNICSSDAFTPEKSSFPFPDDNKCYIHCNDFGSGYIQPCAVPLVWNDIEQTCDYTGSVITKLTTNPSTTLLIKTTTTKLSSSSLSQSSMQSSSLASSVSVSANSSSFSRNPAVTPSSVPVSANTSVVNTKLTANHLSTVPTLGQNEVTCDTCTNDADCHKTICPSDESYCLNVVIIDQHGKQTVLKKSCANFYECKYDHSRRNSLCDSHGAGSSMTTNTSYTCQYCCQATNKSIACNSDTIPKTLDWFEDSSSPAPTVGPTLHVNTTEYSNHSLTASVTSSRFNLSSSNIQTSQTIQSVTSSTNPSSFLFNITSNGVNASSKQPASNTTIISATSTSLHGSNTNITTSSLPHNTTKVHSQDFNRNLTITSGTVWTTSPNSSVSKILRTTTIAKAVKTTTKAPPYTIPPITTKCKVCSGPDFLCEKLFVEKDCNPPDNYCINTISNKKDGSRLVNRRCDNFQTCYRDWFLGSSDNDKCRRFDERQILTLQFDCTFCCIEDNCNLPLRPSDKTLYRDL